MTTTIDNLTVSNRLMVSNLLINTQPAPYTVPDTSGVILTPENLLSGIVTVSNAVARAYELPSGTDMELYLSLPINGCFDWNIININARLLNITPNTGHTIIGPHSILLAGSMLFRTVKRNINTFVTYRIS